MASFAGILSIPLIVINYLCIGKSTYGYIVQSKIISSMFFASSVGTVLQVAIGSRLPILEGASFTFVTPAIALLTSSRFECIQPAVNETEEVIWQERIQSLQGGLIIAAIVQVCIGAFGLVGFLLRFIGPLSIAPVLIQIGISLVEPCLDYCKGNWAVSMIVAAVIVLCVEILHKIAIPIPEYDSQTSKCKSSPLFCFRLFPILIGSIVGIITCVLFTIYDVFPEGDPSRTDSDRLESIDEAPWIFFPYPCQWGYPKFLPSGEVQDLYNTK